MVFSFFRKKRDVEKKVNHLHDSLNSSFSKIKEDIGNVGEWIKHLDETKKDHHKRINHVDSRLKVVEEFMRELMEKPKKRVSKQLSKQPQTVVRLIQTNNLSKQTIEQQEDIELGVERSLISLTAMERVVVWSILNTDLLLSYEDLSRILGKDTSTVRGQINNIKRKIPGLLMEKSESNGKKRFYIDENKKREVLLKYTRKKVKIKKSED